MSAESSAERETVELVVEPQHAGKRLDSYLAEMLPAHSRVQLRRVIVGGGVKVDGLGRKVAFKLVGGERISVCLPSMPTAGPQPENIPLEILYEDDALIAVNKPPFMVVHPARGHWSGTLASALSHHFRELSTAGGATRPGIVHRLDRDTSGVLVCAKADPVHMLLAEQFENRSTEKEYFAIVVGVPDRDRDWIDQPIGPHPYHREKMAIRPQHPDSREAQTFYEVVERFEGFAVVKVLPKTGRTHQIRLHLAYVGHPVLCDRLYGGRSQVTRGEIARTKDEEVLLNRQALHARRLSITHPTTGEPITFEAPLPDDLQGTLDFLREHRSRSGATKR
jgi:23S rRNA pseudouridine1911/1915/1917 synthase